MDREVEVGLKGRILGFENLGSYVLEEITPAGSPFRLLKSAESGISFLVINPYSITAEYTFDLEDRVLEELEFTAENMDNIAVLCIVRYDDGGLYVNLRSPLIVNTEKGLFSQIILENEGYPISVPFSVSQIAE